jgi:hypothetical protein
LLVVAVDQQGAELVDGLVARAPAGLEAATAGGTPGDCMAVLGPMVRAALTVAGLTYSCGCHPELAALKMTGTMAVG